MGLQIEDIPIVAIHIVVVGELAPIPPLQRDQLITDFLYSIVSLGPKPGDKHAFPDVLNEEHSILEIDSGEGDT